MAASLTIDPFALISHFRDVNEVADDSHIVFSILLFLSNASPHGFELVAEDGALDFHFVVFSVLIFPRIFLVNAYSTVYLLQAVLVQPIEVE